MKSDLDKARSDNRERIDALEQRIAQGLAAPVEAEPHGFIGAAEGPAQAGCRS